MSAKLQQIIRVVAAHYKVSPEMMKASRQDVLAALPRHVAMFLAREITGYSLARIGRALDRHDHTTAIYAIKRINDRQEQDAELRVALDMLRCQLAPLTIPGPLTRDAEHAGQHLE